MKSSFSIYGLLLLAITTAGAQVSSHAPSSMAQAPAAKQAASAQAADDAPVARVNGSVLTHADLVREEYTIFPYARQHGGLPKELEPQIRAGALKMMIFEELVYQEALRRKMTVPPAQMRDAEAKFKVQFATPEEFNALLQSEFHGSVPELREKIRRSLLIEAFLKVEVDDKSVVTPAQALAYYKSNPAQFEHPETYTFQTISVLPPAKATADQLKEARQRAEQALGQARATKNAEEFGLLAEKVSDDDYRVMMGQHKPVAVADLPPQVLGALRGMKPGDVSGQIQVENAVTILRMGAHTPAGETKFNDIKTQLEKNLREKKSNELREALDKKLHQDAKIELAQASPDAASMGRQVGSAR